MKWICQTDLKIHQSGTLGREQGWICIGESTWDSKPISYFVATQYRDPLLYLEISLHYIYEWESGITFQK